MKTKSKITRKEARIHLEQFHLACELLRLIKHFFPELISLLRNIKNPRHQSYVIYQTEILLMTKILFSIFYIQSMRKTSEEFNCREAIEHVKTICGNDTLEQLENIIPKLVDRLLRMRCFEDSRVRGKYWQILIDGTQLYHDTNPLDKRCLTKTHRNKEDGSIHYVEYYYYVLEAKLVVKDNIVISIATEFVENSGNEEEKQDCELKAMGEDAKAGTSLNWFINATMLPSIRHPGKWIKYMTYPQDPGMIYWSYLNRKQPQCEPVPVPSEVPEKKKNEITGKDVATGVGVAVGTGAALYGIYRFVRVLPSLAPPLWWTLPANLAIP